MCRMRCRCPEEKVDRLGVQKGVKAARAAAYPTRAGAAGGKRGQAPPDLPSLG